MYKCHIGSCTPRRTLMESTKKKGRWSYRWLTFTRGKDEMVRSSVNTPRLFRALLFRQYQGLSTQVFDSNKKVVVCPHSTPNNVTTGSMVSPLALEGPRKSMSHLRNGQLEIRETLPASAQCLCSPNHPIYLFVP